MVQVLQRCISSGIQSWISDTKESAKLEDFFVYNMIVE